MRAVRAENENELEKEFVGVGAFGKARVAILAADLAEFTGPVGEDCGEAGVREIGVGGTVAAVESAAEGPAAVHAIVHGRVEAEGALDLNQVGGGELVALAKEKFGAP